MTSESSEYSDWLLGCAGEAVAAGADSLEAVVAVCAGADPIAVRAALFALGHHDRLSTGATELEQGREPERDRAVESRLPPPHPVDYDWRFSQAGAGYLLDYAHRLGGGELLLLGATTMALAAAQRNWPGRVVAIDQSAPLVGAARKLATVVEFIEADVGQADTSTFGAQVVVVDPPWYPEFAKPFIWAAATGCSLGGHTLAVLPGEGTRPGIMRERSDFLAWCEHAGLRLVQVLPQSIAYETPLFELNAFRAAGIRSGMFFWRRGDLLVFRRTEREGPPKPPLIEGTHWREVRIGRMRTKFRSDDRPRTGTPSLESLVAGDVLPSVSRRDPRREAVDVWTSGNRVFRCKGTDALYSAAEGLALGVDPVAAAERSLRRELMASEREAITKSCGRLAVLGRQEQDEESAALKLALEGDLVEP